MFQKTCPDCGIKWNCTYDSCVFNTYTTKKYDCQCYVCMVKTYLSNKEDFSVKDGIIIFNNVIEVYKVCYPYETRKQYVKEIIALLL